MWKRWRHGLGAADTQSIFDFLLSSGQDVQLHIHPTFRFYDEWRNAQVGGREYQVPDRDDLIGHFPEELQMDFLGEAAGYFEKFAGRRPEAFRAGCWAGSRSMLRCLRRLGILVDSSFNPCFHREMSFPGERINRAQNIEGVWEIPATVAKTPLPEGANGFKYADCTSLSFAELRAMLDAGAAGGLEPLSHTFHSFSAVKAKDPSYSELRPNRIVIRHLEKMFHYLAENPSRFQVDTMGDFAENAGAFRPAARAQKLTELPLGAGNPRSSPTHQQRVLGVSE